MLQFSVYGQTKCFVDGLNGTDLSFLSEVQISKCSYGKLIFE